MFLDERTGRQGCRRAACTHKFAQASSFPTQCTQGSPTGIHPWRRESSGGQSSGQRSTLSIHQSISSIQCPSYPCLPATPHPPPPPLAYSQDPKRVKVEKKRVLDKPHVHTPGCLFVRYSASQRQRNHLQCSIHPSIPLASIRVNANNKHVIHTVSFTSGTSCLHEMVCTEHTNQAHLAS